MFTELHYPSEKGHLLRLRCRIKAVRFCDSYPRIADQLLDEWDAVHFPRQVPEPRRKAALERLRNAGIVLEETE